MGAGEHALELGRFDPLLQAVVHPGYFRQGVLILGLFTQFDHDAQVFDLLVKPVPGLDDLFQGGALLDDVLRFAGVVPESGNRHDGFDLLDRFAFGIYVKETPEAWRCALRSHSVGLFLHGTWLLLLIVEVFLQQIAIADTYPMIRAGTMLFV